MKIWFIEIGEPLPVEPGARLYRYGMMTRALASLGHEVTWWTSSFSHTARRQVCPVDRELKIGGVNLRILKGPGYRESVSFKRIRHHRDFAEKFHRAARKSAPPDIIVSPIPTIEAAHAAVLYGRESGVPVVIDIRDEWPDEIVDLAPGFLRRVARIFLKRYFDTMSSICRSADGIVGVSGSFLKYGLSFAGRQAGARDQVVPIGYSAVPLDPEKLEKSKEWWISRGVDPHAFVCCFFGTLGNFFAIETVIETARVLSREIRFQVVLCGDGRRLDQYRRMSADLGSVLFPGWVDAVEIAGLMALSRVGLAPYAANTRMSLPNKPFEYFAGGLPVVSSIQGELKDILARFQCGRTYRADSVEELCSVLRDLSASEALREQMGRNARLLLEEHYSIEKISGDFEQYLMKIIKECRPNRNAGRH